MNKRNLNILLVLFLFIGFSSCGSDNEIIADGTVAAQPVTIDGLASLRAIVTNMSFDESQNNHYFTQFNYAKRVTRRNRNNLHWKWRGMRRSITRTHKNNLAVRHEFGYSYESVRDGLLDIIDRTISFTQVDDCVWDLTTSQRDDYKIDVCQSMIANPIVKYSMGNVYPQSQYHLTY
jgi:hypothetical protein